MVAVVVLNTPVATDAVDTWGEEKRQKKRIQRWQYGYATNQATTNSTNSTHSIEWGGLKDESWMEL